MRTHKVQDSQKSSERETVKNTEQTAWRCSKQEIPDEVLHLNTTGVGKAKRKTRRGKRGGVKRKMQNLQREHKKLEAAVGHWIKDIRHKIEASQSDHTPSRDVTVDVLASDVDEMSITPSDVEPLYDYEHYFPEEVTPAANNVIDKQVDMQELNTDPQNVCSYHDNNSTIAQGYGQMEMVSGYGNEAFYGYETIEYGYGNGHGNGYGYGYGHGHGYGNGHGHRYRYGYGHGYGYECENQGYGYGYGYSA